MDDKLQNRLKELIKDNNFTEAIKLAEDNLKRLPETDFNSILSKDFLHLTTNLEKFINTFFDDNKDEVIKAVSREMCPFNVTYDMWTIALLGYSEDGGLDDLEWFGDSICYSNNMLIMSGMESIQKAYENLDYENPMEEILEETADACGLIVMLRLQELFYKTFEIAKNKNIKWANIPFYIAEHDHDLIYRTSIN